MTFTYIQAVVNSKKKNQVFLNESLIYLIY